MNVILIGPPGAGKGTQALRLAAELKAVHLSTGDLLRAAVSANTEMGRNAKAFMDRGSLVPDEVVVGIIAEQLQSGVVTDGMILDGFPRTVSQADSLGRMLEQHGRRLDRVVLLEVAPALIVERISGRRSCPKDGSVYHVKTHPPKAEGRCDRCGAPLVHRSDDREEAVIKRLAAYQEWTAPVVRYYDERGLLRRVDGVGSVDEVFARLRAALA